MGCGNSQPTDKYSGQRKGSQGSQAPVKSPKGAAKPITVSVEQQKGNQERMEKDTVTEEAPSAADCQPQAIPGAVNGATNGTHDTDAAKNDSSSNPTHSSESPTNKTSFAVSLPQTEDNSPLGSRPFGDSTQTTQPPTITAPPLFLPQLNTTPDLGLSLDAALGADSSSDSGDGAPIPPIAQSESHVRESRTLVVGTDDDGNKTINSYVVISDLGRGAFAKVKLAVHIETDQTFAIKIMNKSLLNKVQTTGGLTQAGAVQTEIAILKKLDHPNVTRLYEVIDDPDANKLYLVLEYVEQGPIMKMDEGNFADRDPLPIEKLQAFTRDLIMGLDYLHQNNIIHKDIKPENILVSKDDVVKYTDFGVSANFDKDSNDIVDAYGTPAFMPPEACLGEDNVLLSGKACDIWALGVTLYCLALAKLPFQGSNLNEITAAIIRTEPDYPEGMNHKLRNIITLMLKKNPEDRITLLGLMSHPFVETPAIEELSSDGGSPLLPLTARRNHKVVELTDEEIEGAITVGSNIKLVERFAVLAKMKLKLGKRARGEGSRSGETSDLDITPVAQESPLAASFTDNVGGLTQSSSFTPTDNNHLTVRRVSGGSGNDLCTSGSTNTADNLEPYFNTRKLSYTSVGSSESCDSGTRNDRKSVFIIRSQGQERLKSRFPLEEDVVGEERADNADDIIREAKENRTEKLDLNFTQLGEIPPAVFDLDALQSLLLMKNSIAWISPKIQQLSNLIELSLASNLITSLPDEFSCLVNLEILDLSHNSLDSLPDGIKHMQSLRKINIDLNKFNQLPSGLLNISHLEKVFAVGNPIKTLYEETALKRFHNLQLMIDNRPILTQSWANMNCPNVEVVWNKVYPDAILPTLFLGSVRTAQSAQIFEDLNIKHVVTCGRELVTNVPEGITQVEFDVDDNEVERITRIFDKAHAFLEAGISVGENVLVHCFAGVSRSATIVISYIMKKKHMRLKEAYAFVKERRPAICPNESFYEQLLHYDKLLAEEWAKEDANVSTTPTPNATLDDDDDDGPPPTSEV